MSNFKDISLDEYSDDIVRVIAHMYEDVKNRQEEAYRIDIENGVSEAKAGMKAYPKTRAQLDILMELMKKLDAEFPNMHSKLVMREERVEEV